MLIIELVRYIPFSLLTLESEGFGSFAPHIGSLGIAKEFENSFAGNLAGFNRSRFLLPHPVRPLIP